MIALKKNGICGLCGRTELMSNAGIKYWGRRNRGEMAFSKGREGYHKPSARYCCLGDDSRRQCFLQYACHKAEEAIEINFDQFQNQYHKYELKWSPSEALRLALWIAEQGYWLGSGRNYIFLGQYFPKQLWERPAVPKTGGFSFIVIFLE